MVANFFHLLAQLGAQAVDVAVLRAARVCARVRAHDMVMRGVARERVQAAVRVAAVRALLGGRLAVARARVLLAVRIPFVIAAILRVVHAARGIAGRVVRAAVGSAVAVVSQIVVARLVHVRTRAGVRRAAVTPAMTRAGVSRGSRQCIDVRIRTVQGSVGVVLMSTTVVGEHCASTDETSNDQDRQDLKNAHRAPPISWKLRDKTSPPGTGSF